MKPILVAVLSLFWMVTGHAAENSVIQYKLPLPQVETLANGLTIVWFLDDHLPIVDIALMVKSGNRDDLPGKSGTAELVSQLLERGAGGVSAIELSKRVERLGASSYSQSDDDAMSIGLHGLSQDASTLLEMVSLLALHPDFKSVELNRSQQRMEERWQHLGDSAESLAGFIFSRTITNGSSYARGEMKSISELKKLKREDILQFHKTHFTPKNSVLMVVGRVDQKAIRNQIESLFGGWSGDAPTRHYQNYFDPRFKHEKGEIIVVHRADLPQAQIRMGFPIPSLYSKNRHALAVANALLGEYFNSRLNLVVRDQLGLAYGISSSLAYSRAFSFLGLASATHSKQAGTLLLKTNEILNELTRKGTFPDEIVTAKEYMLGGFPLSVATLGAIAVRWLGGYVYGLGPDYLNEFVPKVNEVTKASVDAAIQEAFHLDQMVVVVAGDANQIIPALKKSGYKKIKRVSSVGWL
jgi:zinc protease